MKGKKTVGWKDRQTEVMMEKLWVNRMVAKKEMRMVE